jgi:hypothetical protein
MMLKGRENSNGEKLFSPHTGDEEIISWNKN